MSIELQQRSQQVADLLAAKRKLLVLAESCTGGLVAASLAGIPGISNYLCGSAVTYQNATKQRWLGISSKKLVNPGPVSQVVARLMAERVLAKTPQADFAASVTGHLGPQAPAKFDGLVFVAVSLRKGAKCSTTTYRHRLKRTSRLTRQREAAAIVLSRVLRTLEAMPQ